MLRDFNPSDLRKIYTPPADSHKGHNGKLLLIGGSHLFHAASLWSLEIASRIVDMVFYASIPENNQIVQTAKEEFRNGIVVSRESIEDYVQEADCVLMGPGMVRAEGAVDSTQYSEISIEKINSLEDEGEQTYALTKYLLEKYPKKRWVIDGGALQMMEKEWLTNMPSVMLTPHKREFERLFDLSPTEENVRNMAQEYAVTILLKGEEDIVCSPFDSAQAVRGSEDPSGSRRGEIRCERISGGNAGMTKGGTGDVLAGLVGAFACKNDLFLAAKAGAYINKKAGESLYKKVGNVFNSSDLVSEIPSVMKQLTS